MVKMLPKLRNLKLPPILERQLLHAVLSLLWEREVQTCHCDEHVHLQVGHTGQVAQSTLKGQPLPRAGLITATSMDSRVELSG